MIITNDSWGGYRVEMLNGAVFKLREDSEGDLEIRETTHRYLNIKPQARNTVYISAEDPTLPPSVVLVNKVHTTPADYAIGREPDNSPDSPHPGKPHEDCCK